MKEKAGKHQHDLSIPYIFNPLCFGSSSSGAPAAVSREQNVAANDDSDGDDDDDDSDLEEITGDEPKSSLVQSGADIFEIEDSDEEKDTEAIRESDRKRSFEPADQESEQTKRSRTGDK